jgi:hypothetical protein
VKLATTPTEQRAWLTQWRGAELALKQVKREELAALTDERAREISRMLLGAVKFPRPAKDGPETSGLVEQQRLFRKLKC